MLSTVGSIVSHTAGVSPGVLIVLIGVHALVSIVRSVLAFLLMNKALDKLDNADAKNRAVIVNALTTMWRKPAGKR